MRNTIALDVECIVCKKTLQKITHDPQVRIDMGKITNKRTRTPNWSTDEKHYLLELIRENRDVVITKTNNGPNQYEEKDAAWNSILCKLSEKFGNKFTEFSIKKLKTQWQNMKRIAREEITNNGDQLHRYTKLSLDVCDVMKLIKNGVLKKENLNDTTITTDIEIKTECVDEEMNDGSCELNSFVDLEDRNGHRSAATTVVVEDLSDTSCTSERNDILTSNKKSVDTMTDFTNGDLETIVALRNNLEQLIRCADSEKQLKLESLKDQRQIMKAMRETAELNKIIAEQKLKHVLWLKKHDIA